MAEEGIIFPEGKNIVFCLCGGPRDGDRTSLDVISPAGIHGEAATYWEMTCMGKAGKQIPVISLHANQMRRSKSGPIVHAYEVEAKDETENEILVRCKYVGPNEPKVSQ